MCSSRSSLRSRRYTPMGKKPLIMSLRQSYGGALWGLIVWTDEKPIPRNSDGNPDSPQTVVFSASIIDVTVAS